MYCWLHRNKQVLSCKSCHTFRLLNHCFGAIFHWLYFLNILWILDFYSIFFYIVYHLIVAFFLFSIILLFFFSFSIITITFSLITLFHLLLAHAFCLVFIDFTLFKFYFCSSTLSILFPWFSFVFLGFFKHFFFDFLVIFYSLTLFKFFVVGGFYLFSWKFLATLMLWLLFSSTM